MIGKTNWKQYLRKTRKRELDLVFSLLPKTHFVSGLEIGAGDGYQATLLAHHVDALISSDLNLNRLKESLKVTGVVYRVLDADEIEGEFEPGTFDLIFSSSVLEHLRDPKKFLAVTHSMLSDGGLAVHIVPSRHLKIFYLLFYYPHMALLALDRFLGVVRGKPFFRSANVNFENNLNVKAKPQKPQSRLKRFLFPVPHGNYRNHTEEFMAWGKGKWERLFLDAGYDIVTYARGPVFSGYGFGYAPVRQLLEYLGMSSEHIFILKRTS